MIIYLYSQLASQRDSCSGMKNEGCGKIRALRQLDFDQMEQVSGSYITDELRDREDDMIWRVWWRDRWLYVYVLLDFQSSVDKFMTIRIMSYLGLLYQDLIRQ